MKVKITDEARRWLTLAELPSAKQMIAEMKEDESSAAEYLATAAACWLHNSENAHRADDVVKVLAASAEIAGNARIWNRYNDESGRLDVWLTGTVETFYGFLKIGCYLSDVWEIGPEDVNRAFPRFTYSRYYVEQAA